MIDVVVVVVVVVVRCCNFENCGGIVVARVACGHRSLWQATRNSSCGSTLTIVHRPIEKVSIQGCIVNAAWIICLWAAAGGGGQTGF